MIFSAGRLKLLLAVLTASAANDGAFADTLNLTDDGWHTWRVAAAQHAPDSCCFQWNSGVAKRRVCDLDKRQNGYSRSDDQSSVVSEMQIYALTRNGELQKIRALDSRCPVSADTEIVDLGYMETDDSIDWLQQRIDSPENKSSDVMAAISTHEGERPIDVLMDIVRTDSNMENRKAALFWLAMSDSDTAYEFLDRLLGKT